MNFYKLLTCIMLEVPRNRKKPAVSSMGEKVEADMYRYVVWSWGQVLWKESSWSKLRHWYISVNGKLMSVWLSIAET